MAELIEQERVVSLADESNFSLRTLICDEERDFLIRNNGEKVKIDELEGKYVGLYFSAHWCPPCRTFTPILSEIYAKLLQKGDFEIVFISADVNIPCLVVIDKEGRLVTTVLSVARHALRVFVCEGGSKSFNDLKIALRNVHIRRGLLLLVPEVVDILGGVVDHLEAEAAHQRLVQEVNKPPRGRRNRRGGRGFKFGFQSTCCCLAICVIK